ncbi:MAG: hypothetical protein L0Y66_13350, partial [Myxococcaceae bacterium]|nr:hypothetical protein [Myxococcaceae bacterium]
MSLLTLLALVGALYWASVSLLLLRVMRSVPEVRALRAPPPAVWPRVSLVMPARNEEAHLASALQT